ncbi:MAG: APC family permease [Bdellovibrionales bacterium]
MTSLKRSLSLPLLTFYGTGMILGAGIYSIIGKAAAKTDETLWLSFILAAVAALLTGLSYAELSTLFPKAGGEFVYLRETFKKHPWIGSMVGVSVAGSGAATAATVSVAFGGYLNQFFQTLSPQLSAVVLLLLFAGIAIYGITESSWVTVTSTLIEVMGLLLIIYFGMTSEKFGEALSATPHWGTLSGAGLIIFSFFGFENIVNLAEETKKPERDLSRAILLSISISTILYVLVSLSALALLSPEALSKSDAPLMAAAETISAKLGQLLGSIALFSTANTTLISIIGASRILYGMGKERVLPLKISSILPKRQTPWIASLIILVASLLFLPLGNLEVIASVSAFLTLTAFCLVNVALIVLRHTEPDKKRPFRIPFQVGKTPLLPLVAALLAVLLMFQLDATTYVMGGTFLAFSAVSFYWYERKS